VVAREPGRDASLQQLGLLYLEFLEQAQLPDGRFRNRRSLEGWTDEGGSDDSFGRVLFGLGAAVSAGGDELTPRALACFEAGAARFASISPRANAYAVVGAAEVAAAHPAHPGATALFEQAVQRLGSVSSVPGWPWPEERLAYDNARLAEARIAGGVAFGVPALVEDGLELLDWLVGIELSGDHFSFVPAAGLGRGDRRPGFDQQPIEAGSMADACVRAYRATGAAPWAGLGVLAARWLTGANDIGIPLLDPETGGCCDGLQAVGRNENQGAESTIAALTALQAARELHAAARSAPSSSSVETQAAPTQRSAAPYVM
jgi:hypothetical protein